MYRKILVPTDGSSLSQQAAEVAIEFARVHGAELVALSVAQPTPVTPGEGALAMDPAAESRTLLGVAQQNVDQVLDKARAAGVGCTGAVALNFLPHEEIIRTADEHGCDVVFMASHGRHGLSRLLAGSVTQNVLSYSTIPVLVLRPGVPH